VAFVCEQSDELDVKLVCQEAHKPHVILRLTCAATRHLGKKPIRHNDAAKRTHGAGGHARYYCCVLPNKRVLPANLANLRRRESVVLLKVVDEIVPVDGARYCFNWRDEKRMEVKKYRASCAINSPTQLGVMDVERRRRTQAPTQKCLGKTKVKSVPPPCLRTKLRNPTHHLRQNLVGKAWPLEEINVLNQS
jgi:hypothetical protein